MTTGEIIRMFSYPFMTRGLVVGVVVSMCAALLGVVLVLKRYSLIGHGLADVGFASLSLALALGLPPLTVSIPVVILASFMIMAYSQKKGVHGDVAIGIAATAALAVGIMITAYKGGFNIDIANYMFGSILSVSSMDMYISLILSVIVIGLFILFYNRLFLITCDENFAKALGINVTAYQFLISFLTAVTVVIGMRMMGTLLISSLIIFPAVSARKLVQSFKAMVIVSALISVLCCVTGIFLSWMIDIPTGAGIVMINMVFMLVVTGINKIKR